MRKANNSLTLWAGSVRRTAIRAATLGLAAGIATAGIATAQPNDVDEDGVPVGSTGEALSQIGIERGLDLYDRDASDPCKADRTQVRVFVTNTSPVGILKLELFGEKDFMKKSGKLRKIRVPAEAEPMLVCIDVPEPGEYAVVGYHDKDGDRRLDKKWNFKPKEPYGLSNNPKIESLRLPKWEETRFSVPVEGRDIGIDLVDLS